MSNIVQQEWDWPPTRRDRHLVVSPPHRQRWHYHQYSYEPSRWDQPRRRIRWKIELFKGLLALGLLLLIWRPLAIALVILWTLVF